MAEGASTGTWRGGATTVTCGIGGASTGTCGKGGAAGCFGGVHAALGNGGGASGLDAEDFNFSTSPGPSLPSLGSFPSLPSVDFLGSAFIIRTHSTVAHSKGTTHKCKWPGRAAVQAPFW